MKKSNKKIILGISLILLIGFFIYFFGIQQSIFSGFDAVSQRVINEDISGVNIELTSTCYGTCGSPQNIKTFIESDGISTNEDYFKLPQIKKDDSGNFPLSQEFYFTNNIQYTYYLRINQQQELTTITSKIGNASCRVKDEGTVVEKARPYLYNRYTMECRYNIPIGLDANGNNLCSLNQCEVRGVKEIKILTFIPKLGYENEVIPTENQIDIPPVEIPSDTNNTNQTECSLNPSSSQCSLVTEKDYTAYIVWGVIIILIILLILVYFKLKKY